MQKCQGIEILNLMSGVVGGEQEGGAMGVGGDREEPRGGDREVSSIYKNKETKILFLFYSSCNNKVEILKS